MKRIHWVVGALLLTGCGTGNAPGTSPNNPCGTNATSRASGQSEVPNVEELQAEVAAIRVRYTAEVLGDTDAASPDAQSRLENIQERFSRLDKPLFQLLMWEHQKGSSADERYHALVHYASEN